MQKQYYFYDENSFYIEPTIVNISDLSDDTEMESGLIPYNATDIRPPDGLYKAKFNPITQSWSEAANPRRNRRNITSGY